MYEVNKGTCIIKYKAGKSKIVENKTSFDVDATPTEIIKYSCEYFGSTFEGRLRGSQILLGCKYKLPIVIAEHMSLIFVPTEAVRNKTCSWVNVSNIKSYRRQGKSVLVEFKSGYKTKLPISLFSFENQLLRSYQLAKVLNQRKNN